MTRAALLLAALAALLSAPMTAHAQRLRVPGVGEVAVSPPPPPRQPAPPAARAATEVREYPLPDVLSGLNRRAPGKLLDAKRGTQGGRPVYLISWAAEGGRRIDYVVDAERGNIISQKGD